MKLYCILAWLPLFIFSCSGNDSAANKTAVDSAKHSSMDSLRAKIVRLIEPVDANVSVALIGLEDCDTLSVNGNRRMTIMSVVKFPQAMTILRKVDEGKLSPDQQLHFGAADLRPDTWGPLMKAYPDKKELDLSLQETLRFAVGTSDNNACDRLFKLVPPQEVETYIRGLGVNIGIGTDYAHMKENGFTANWSTASDMAKLLEIFYRRTHLSASSSDLLWKIMTESENPSDRIKGQLPPGTVVAHKSGTMDQVDGQIPAFNDIGIVTLPNGKHFAIAVLINDSKAAPEVNAKLIASIAKAAWDELQ